MDSRARSRERFAAIAAGSMANVDLAEASLWIAASRQADLDVADQLDRIEALAERARERVRPAPRQSDVADALTRFFVDEGFRGNTESYYDPRNSYLNEVLDRRTGIPITLSILWISVARRLGLSAQGVGFPGHFLAMLEAVGGQPAVWVDVFGGRVVEERDCEELLDRISGGTQPFQTGYLAPITHREILARVLRNLKQIGIARRDWVEAVGCADQILQLEPDNPLELRDRGLLQRALDDWDRAEADLRRYLELVPAAPDRLEVEALLEQRPRLH